MLREENRNIVYVGEKDEGKKEELKMKEGQCKKPRRSRLKSLPTANKRKEVTRFFP